MYRLVQREGSPLHGRVLFVVAVGVDGTFLGVAGTSATSEARCQEIGRAVLMTGNRDREAAAAADRTEMGNFMLGCSSMIH